MRVAVTIWSHWTGEEWSGNVTLTDAPPPAQLEELFRQFNRLEERDNRRLETIGYDLPSLSMGDVVTLDGERWKCAAMGWERENAPPPGWRDD